MTDDQVGQFLHNMDDIAAEHGSLRALNDIAAELRVFNELALTMILSEARGADEEREGERLVTRLNTIRSRMGSSCPASVAEPYEEEVIDLSLSSAEVGH